MKITESRKNNKLDFLLFLYLPIVERSERSHKVSCALDKLSWQFLALADLSIADQCDAPFAEHENAISKF